MAARRAGWYRTLVAAFGAALGLVLAPPALALQPLDDGALSRVAGGDGFNFNLQDFSLSGKLSFTYTSPAGASLKFGDLAISRSDDPDHSFDDPYSLWIERRGGGLADMVVLSQPLNTAGLQRWQFAGDLSVNASDLTHDLGALVLQDLAFYGGGLQLSTPTQADVSTGIGFGLSLRAELGALVLRPLGRVNASEELRLSGLRLGAVDANGQFTHQPWALADVTTQPGLLRAITDEKGPALQLLVDWNTTADGAPRAGLAIDNIRFTSPVTGVTDLGSSRIGSMQINFVDIRLRPGS